MFHDTGHSLMTYIMSNNNQNSSSTDHKDTEIDHSSEKSQMNVEFVESQPLVQDDARLGYSLNTLPPIMEQQMPDEHWMAAKQLSKPVVIRQFQWTEDSTAGAQLNTFDFPAVIGENDSIHQETLRMYTFFKFNWVLRFQINGTKFHSGQLIVSWDPFSQAGAANARYRPFNIVYATGLPNVLLNASSNEPVEITIPFVHPRNFLTTNSSRGFDRLGTVRVNVLNPLRAAEGSSSSLSITTWLYADSPSVHVPIYRHDLKIPNRERAVPTMDLVSGLLGEGVGGLLNDVGSTFGNVLTGNFGGAIKSGGKSLTGIANLLGLDYPSRPVIEQSHINPLGPMSPGKGVDMSYRLGTDPRGGHVPTPAQTGSMKDECDMDVIKKVPMLFRQVEWSDARTVGSVLTYFPVTPNICAIDNGIGQNTFLSWLSNGFCFFRGALTYKFEWVSTQFHTGRVLIAFIPNYFDGTPTLQQAFSVPNAVVDLQQSSVVNVTVPFTSPTNLKRTDITTTGGTDDQVVGFVYVYVLNQLVRPSNVADTVEFNIYIHAEDDFEFLVPKANELAPFRTAPASRVPDEVDERAVRTNAVDRMEARSAAQDSSGAVSVAFGSPLISGVDLFGEKFTLVDYMKRYGQISTRTLKGPTVQYELNGPTPLRDADGNIIVTPDVGYLQLTPLTTVTSMFAAWFGSLRYKLATDINRTISGSLTVTYNPLDPALFQGYISGSGLPIQRTNVSQNNSLDVELPCYTNYNLLLLQPASGDTPFIDAGVLAANIKCPDDATYVLDTYQAAGDDFRPFYLISPPADFSGTALLHAGIPLRVTTPK
uniref:Structural polyprotein n=1 Tax=Picornavirales sp. TaxID=1955153 RepID=A0A6M9Z7G4_9VIRU|nr:MAG: structural polyprotein [Picornavirales sp.]QKN88976.1 MAG: structural polyprotein [Picornavirales sp.]QKN88978.1 MAG: structural polyprotein [Picornavirales sp.]